MISVSNSICFASVFFLHSEEEEKNVQGQESLDDFERVKCLRIYYISIILLI